MVLKPCKEWDASLNWWSLDCSHQQCESLGDHSFCLKNILLLITHWFPLIAPLFLGGGGRLTSHENGVVGWSFRSKFRFFDLQLGSLFNPDAHFEQWFFGKKCSDPAEIRRKTSFPSTVFLKKTKDWEEERFRFFVSPVVFKNTHFFRDFSFFLGFQKHDPTTPRSWRTVRRGTIFSFGQKIFGAEEVVVTEVTPKGSEQ